VTSEAWRRIGAQGEAYPAWVRALRGRSGVYAIRLPSSGLFGFGGPVVVYVGESHTGNLYGTLTRHFQVWSRQKSWWVTSGYRPSQGDPGHTYRRADVEVRARVVPASASAARAKELAARWQVEWFDALAPRDNMIEPVPF
jgi:hypothetical protein